jgi:hypothetical protein
MNDQGSTMAAQLYFRRFFRSVFILVVALLPAGCADMQGMAQWKPSFMQQNFTPLTDDVAAMAAAPQSGEGAPVLCSLGSGAAHFDKGWLDFKKSDFILPPGGQQASIPIQAVKGGNRASLRGFYDEAGQKMIFCPLVDGPPDERIDCFSLYVLGDDLDVGVKRTFDVPDAIRGASITCAHDKNKLQPL